MKAFAALVGAGYTVGACYALGAVIAARLGTRLRREEKFPLAFVLGAAVLHLALFAIMTLKVAYTPVLLLLLTACVVAALITGNWRLPPQEPPHGDSFSRRIRYLFGAIAIAFTVLYFFNAWAPEISPDGSGYHLTLVALYLRAHGFRPVLTNVLSTFSGGVDILFLPAFAIGKHSAAALVHFAFLIALALEVWAYGRRIGHFLAGAAAALLVYASPVVGIDQSLKCESNCRTLIGTSACGSKGWERTGVGTASCSRGVASNAIRWIAPPGCRLRVAIKQGELRPAKGYRLGREGFFGRSRQLGNDKIGRCIRPAFIA
jgi:hypothetical protein